MIISDYGGLFGQKDQAFGGPGLVDYATVNTFGKISEIAEKVKGKDSIIFYGNLVFEKKESKKPYLSEGKKVIILFNAKHKGLSYEVNRRPWDN